MLLFQYLDIVRTSKYYGYIQFAPCFCDYPQPDSKVLVAIGRNELNLRILNDGEQCEEVFKVSRMRCWRITTLQNVNCKRKTYSNIAARDLICSNFRDLKGEEKKVMSLVQNYRLNI